METPNITFPCECEHADHFGADRFDCEGEPSEPNAHRFASAPATNRIKTSRGHLPRPNRRSWLRGIMLYWLGWKRPSERDPDGEPDQCFNFAQAALNHRRASDCRSPHFAEAILNGSEYSR